MSLRDACRRAAEPPEPVDITWHYLPAAGRAIASKWADRPVRPLPTFELDAIVGSARLQWTSRGNLEALSRRDAGWLPYALFHPESDPDAWLARDAGFVDAALVRMRQRTRGVRSLLRNVLRLWPKDLSTVVQIQQMLVAELRGATTPRMVQWRQRVQEFDLLSLQGPRKLADRLSANPQQREEILGRAGLNGELGRCRFLAESDRHIADDLHDHLRGGRFAKLEPSLSLLAPGGTLTFPAQVAHVANALLLPFTAAAPPQDTLRRIRSFLLTHMGDPRLTKTGWVSVAPAAKQVMLRWLVEGSLEEFFRLIERSADNDHWRYRQAFWSAYLRRGHISDAWVILGENAASDAERHWRQDAPASGRLYRADVAHSALLLQIGNLVIAEWSHNGTCRVWRLNDRGCPSFYQSVYVADTLRGFAAHEQVHHGNHQYTWQRTLSTFIRDETKIAMPQAEYRVR